MSIFPPTFSDVLTVNYYDNYVNLGFSPPTKVLEQDTAENTKGMATASYIRILNQSKWEMTYTVYDKKSRPIGTYKTNYLGGYTHVETLLNFRGLPIKTETKHKRDPNGIEITVIDHFEYDSQERLLWHIQKINEETPQMIAFNTYDELGQLINKKVGGTAAQSIDQERWQSIDYRYNIRGWLTDINDTEQLQKTGKPADLFAFKINYNNPVAGDFQTAGLDVQPLFNGNIAETYWRTASDNTLRGYGYAYDELNRLKSAYYRKPNTVTPLPQTFDEYLAYDLNGNITGLQRYSGDDSPTGTFPADDLEYTYFTGSNQLKSVSDSTNSNFGFEDGNTNPALDDYEYDLNGNMTLDRNKGITTIVYNHLNLPIEIQWNSTKKIEYLYNAAGGKVQKKVTNGANIKTTDYLDGFQYNQLLLEFFPHAEGYVKATNLSLGNNPNYAFNYVYNYTDHLGNVRVSYTKDPHTGNLKILDESHYYPFGLKHQEYQASSFTTNPIQGVIIAPLTNNPYKYKYNGFEYQDELDLGWYDYMARNYDPALGRWMNIDPLAEMSRKTSPYVYALNNPVFFIDPDGMEADSFSNDWKDNGDGTYTAESGDSAATLAKDAGISHERANEIVQAQLGDNNVGSDGVEKSNVEVGDIVEVPENIPIELEPAEIVGFSPQKISTLKTELNKLDSMIEVNNEIIDFNKMANEISEDANLNQPTPGEPKGGIYFGEELNKERRRRIIRKTEKEREKNIKKRDSIKNILPSKTVPIIFH